MSARCSVAPWARAARSQRALRVITAIFPMINMQISKFLSSSVCAWRLHSALSIHWHSCLKEDAVAHIVVLPNCQEDEATLRESPENLVRSLSAERRVLIALAMEAFESLNSQDKAGTSSR